MTGAVALSMLAPYAAVLLCWCWLANGWAAILTYHAAIVVGLLAGRRTLPRIGISRWWWATVPFAIAGPVAYLLLPHITITPVSTWLDQHGLEGIFLLIMVPYFGLLHPALEQLHWAPLRERTPLSHVVFAGYHMLVLEDLLQLPWLLVVFLLLAATSFGWHILSRRCGQLGPAIGSHILADLGIVLAALMLV